MGGIRSTSEEFIAQKKTNSKKKLTILMHDQSFKSPCMETIFINITTICFIPSLFKLAVFQMRQELENLFPLTCAPDYL